MKAAAPTLLAALLLCVVACTATDEATDPPVAATVTLQGTTFEPKTVTIKVGETVRWEWVDGDHNVVSGTGCTSDGQFTSGAPASGSTFERRFDEAGTFEYFCDPHCSMGMTGQVVVR